MGVMEEILQQLKQLNKKIDSLPAAGQDGNPVLIDGKVSLSTPEASELTGIGRQNLCDMARVGKIPHFKNGSYYMFPVKALLDWMDTEAYRNMEKNTEPDFDELEYFKLTS